MNVKLFLLFGFCLVLFLGCVGPKENFPGEKSNGKEETGTGGTGEKPEPFTPEDEEDTGPITPEDENSEDVQKNEKPGEEFHFPPLEQSSISLPEGEWKTLTLGEVEIRYFSTAIMRGNFETSTDILFFVKNKGSSTKIVQATLLKELAQQKPENVYHFFGFQKDEISIASGEEKKFWYYISNEPPIDFELEVTFEVGSEEGTAIVHVKEEDLKSLFTAYIYGVVTDKQTGEPVKDATVIGTLFNGREGFTQVTDEFGRYVLPVTSMQDIQNVFGNRTVLYNSLAYSISAEKDGYQFFYENNLSPGKEEQLRLDIELEKSSGEKDFALAWEKQVQDNYGFFWVMPSKDFSVIAAAQAKHPPELQKPTHFYLFSEEGTILWQQDTGSECWGFDITDDGNKIAAACHDGYTYVVSKGGTLLWKGSSVNQVMTREAEFSPSGNQLITGPYGEDSLALVDSSDGETINEYTTEEWLRNSKFYLDGSGYLTGHGGGTILAFDMNGNNKWEQIIGEFPLMMEVDQQNNVYLSGKGRTLFSYDEEGNLRWTYRIGDHTITAGDISDNGKLAAGTVGGQVYLFDSDGNLLWRRGACGQDAQGCTVGHNAVDISSDGKYIVVGSAPQNGLVVFDENGTLVWSYTAEIKENSEDLLVGAVTVAISDDDSKIVAGYGDNYIRMFELN